MLLYKAVSGVPKGMIINYFNIKPYITSSLEFLSFHLIQVDSGQTTIIKICKCLLTKCSCKFIQ